jgi:hypothetical protein
VRAHERAEVHHDTQNRKAEGGPSIARDGVSLLPVVATATRSRTTSQMHT